MPASYTYLRNRANFYEALLPRIPNLILRERLNIAATPVRYAPDLVELMQELPDPAPETPPLSALRLDDLLKKSHAGRQFGLTTISFDDALDRAEHIERVGLIWFQTLIKQELIPLEEANLIAEGLSRCLGKILALRDDLEYHRLKLVPSA